MRSTTAPAAPGTEGPGSSFRDKAQFIDELEIAVPGEQTVVRRHLRAPLVDRSGQSRPLDGNRPPPPWRSAIKTLRPGITVDGVLIAMSSHEHGCVAHSFGELTLSSHGLKLLIDATWLYRDPENPRRAARSPGWSVIAREPLLREWNRKHHTDGVRLPTMLTHPRFTIVVHHDREALTAGSGSA